MTESRKEHGALFWVLLLDRAFEGARAEPSLERDVFVNKLCRTIYEDPAGVKAALFAVLPADRASEFWREIERTILSSPIPPPPIGCVL